MIRPVTALSDRDNTPFRTCPSCGSGFMTISYRELPTFSGHVQNADLAVAEGCPHCGHRTPVRLFARRELTGVIARCYSCGSLTPGAELTPMIRGPVCRECDEFADQADVHATDLRRLLQPALS